MINPVGMTLLDWADSVILATPDTWALGRLDDPDRWQDWAMGLVRASSTTQCALPDPFQFDDWREWAQRAYPLLEG